MLKQIGVCLLWCCLSLALVVPSASGRALPPAVRGADVTTNPMALAPAYSVAAHRVNNMTLGVSNNGTFGNGFAIGSLMDQFTGQPVPGCEYPKGSRVDYLFAGALWIGGVVGGDTLVSTGADGWFFVHEFHPDAAPQGLLQRRSTLDPMSPGYENAVSEQDLIAVYTDTFIAESGEDPVDGAHRPLNVQVVRTSYAWSYAFTEDFVIFQYQITNIGNAPISNALVGLYVDGDVASEGSNGGYSDDITGYVSSDMVDYGGCAFEEQQNMAWIADNDGDLAASLPAHPAPAVTGTKLLAFPSEYNEVRYNWWVSNGNAALDFGPRLKSTAADPFRDFGTGGTGTPVGDANKYYVLNHHEVDYDQVFTASVSPGDSVWLQPPASIAADVTDGFDTRYLLSIGPMTIGVGETLPLVFAYVAGQGFHSVPGNINNLPNNPQAFMSNLNFDDLLANGRWASWVYDNPGVDTDSDGYAGQFHICNGDTIYYTGDRVPDYRAASPPPPPKTWVTAGTGSLNVRWNGLLSEETYDVFSHQKDFEGYKVYFTQQGSGGGYSLLDSWDREDWYKFVWNEFGNRWEPDRRLTPYSRQELQCAYGAIPNPCWDTLFDPDAYSESHPFMYNDTIMYFAPVDLNHSEFGVQTDIVKTYPDQPYPSTLDPSQADPSELTPDGFFKYFEYQLEIPNLLPTEEYCVKVTAFDFGSQMVAIPSLESNAEPHCAVPQMGGPIPTYEWINVYCESPLLNGAPLSPGTVIEAFDPDGIMCGRDSVRSDGAYGFMPVYRDDPYSTADEGADPGDTITFKVNGQDVQTSTTIIWTANGAGYELCYFAACQTLHLNAGWNLISWNRQLVMGIDELMVLLADCDVEVILGFDRGALTYDPQLPEFSTLDVVDYFHGYWIKVGNGCDIDFCAPPIPLQQGIPITTGWNLVSYWPEQQLPIEVALMSMYHDLLVALGFDGGGVVHLPNDALHSTLTALDPGHGYWLKSFVDNFLAYPGYGTNPSPVASITTAQTEIAPSREWMSIYGKGITLDGKPLAEGALIEAYSADGALCGSGHYSNGILKFTPVYGRDVQSEVSSAYPTAGSSVELRVDGQPVTPTLTFAGAGARTPIGRLTSGEGLPDRFGLAQNYPNPFNPSTEIRFDLPEAADVKLEVFNVVGQRVEVLVDQRLEAGSHTVTFDGNSLASGMYLYRLQAGSYTESRKMMLLK